VYFAANSLPDTDGDENAISSAARVLKERKFSLGTHVNKIKQFCGFINKNTNLRESSSLEATPFRLAL